MLGHADPSLWIAGEPRWASRTCARCCYIKLHRGRHVCIRVLFIAVLYHGSTRVGRRGNLAAGHVATMLAWLAYLALGLPPAGHLRRLTHTLTITVTGGSFDPPYYTFNGGAPGVEIKTSV